MFDSAFFHLDQRLANPSVAGMIGEPLFKFMRRRPRCSPFSLSAVRQVLVVRPDEIGDVVMTVPFLRELRKNLPQASIRLVVKPALRDLMKLCPYVDDVLTYDRRDAGSFTGLRSMARIVWLSIAKLWPCKFDLAVFPRWDGGPFEGPYLNYWSGAPWRVGYSEHVAPWKEPLNRGCDALYTHLSGSRRMQHEVLSNLDLIRFMGGEVHSDHLEIWRRPEDDAFADEILTRSGVTSHDSVIAMAVGTRLLSKRWPFEKFIQAGRELARKGDTKILLLGGAQDCALGACPSDFAIIDLRGKTTLRQVAALLKRATIYVGNDTGAMHMAAAARTPVVQVSCHFENGSPDVYPWPDRFGAWQVPQTIVKTLAPTAPCIDQCLSHEPHCIKTVSVERVVDAAHKMLLKNIYFRAQEALRVGARR